MPPASIGHIRQFESTAGHDVNHYTHMPYAKGGCVIYLIYLISITQSEISRAQMAQSPEVTSRNLWHKLQI